MIVTAIAPSPSTRNLQDREGLAGKQLGRNRLLDRGSGIDEGWTGAAAANERAGIMRREELASQRDIGDIAAIGMNPLVENERGTAKRETLSRAEG